MKNLILLLVFLFSSSFIFAQVNVKADKGVPPVDINKMEDLKYIKIVGHASNPFKPYKLKIVVDFGQKVKLFDAQQQITDNEGNVIIFHTMISALNFMDKNGWDYVSNFVVTMGDSNVYNYLLKRKIIEEENEITTLETKEQIPLND